VISSELAMSVLGHDLAVPLVDECFAHLGRIEDLRRPLSDQCVVVTGGAGSIGGALAVELLTDPDRTAPVVLIDTNERGIAALTNWVTALGLQANLVIAVADVCDEVQVAEVFDRIHADVVVHAAAVKHVGTCETNPRLARRVNVDATRILVAQSERSGVDRFVLVSSDKATSRINMLGRTKYEAELVVAEASGRGLGSCSVRLPNVWGSSGSVIELWRQTMAMGLPVTLFGPETTRYYQPVYDTVRILLSLTTDAAAHDGSTFIVAEATRLRLQEVLDRVGGEGVLSRVELPRAGEIAHEQLTSPDEQYETSAWSGILRLRHDRQSAR
jgi:FlaA1/EpsC-like NDP-sugar epimerase